MMGDNCWLPGGLAGHSGTFENAPTLVENGTVKNVSIETGRNSERIGGITGGGFYSPMFKEYYPEPAKSDIKSCTVSEFTVLEGKYVGTAVGFSYGTTSVDGFDGQMTWDGSESKEQAERVLDQLGIPMSNAVGMFLRQVVFQQGIPFEMKLPKKAPLAYGSLTKEQFDAEIGKGMEDIREGRVYSADAVEEEMRRDYGI